MNSNELIVEIFNKMNFERKSIPKNNSEDNNYSVPGYIYESLKNDREPKSFGDALQDAQEALEKWKSVSSKKRAYSLHKVWEALVKKSQSLPNLKNELSLLIDYFDFYADMAEQIEENLGTPMGVTLIILPIKVNLHIIAATVPAALAAGCTVIVHASYQAVIPLYLEKLMNEAGLPVGMLNVVTEPLPSVTKFSYNQIFLCRDFLTCKAFLSAGYYESVKYFCSNSATALLVLESCDLNAVVGEIFCKTWDNPSLWRVSTVVVQESVFDKFMDKLKHKMENFLGTNGEFKDGEILRKINDAISKAVKEGASVEKSSCDENEWGPTALVNYQSQDENLRALPILNVLVCRSPKEGVKLLNNCRDFLGTSIWSEFSAQALEAASALKCPNIWINCHGVCDAKVPLVTAGFSGNSVLGGAQGILQYLSCCNNTNTIELESLQVKDLEINYNSEIALSAQKAFNSWRKNNNKRKYFKALTDFLEMHQDAPLHVNLSKSLSLCTNSSKLPEKNYTDDFFIVYQEEPIGVICLFLSKDVKPMSLFFLIALPIKLGNVVILVTENQSVIEMANLFNQFFPKNVLTVISDKEPDFRLVNDPIVQAVWICSQYPVVRRQYGKRTWVFTAKDEGLFKQLTVNECMRYKIIWLPKVEKFP